MTISSLILLKVTLLRISEKSKTVPNDLFFKVRPLQPVFICSKSNMETLKQYVCKVCSKLTIKTPKRPQ